MCRNVEQYWNVFLRQKKICGRNYYFSFPLFHDIQVGIFISYNEMLLAPRRFVRLTLSRKKFEIQAMLPKKNIKLQSSNASYVAAFGEY